MSYNLLIRDFQKTRCSPSKPVTLPNSDLFPQSLSRWIAVVLALSLVFGSLRAWIRLVLDYRLGNIWLKQSDEPRATWDRLPEWIAVFLSVLMLILHLVSQLGPPEVKAEPEAMTPERLRYYLLTSGGLIIVMLAILRSSQRSLAEFGIQRHGLQSQVRVGCEGFLLAILPTAVLMVATAGIRNVHNQNPLLTMLSSTSAVEIIVAICGSAAILAPLSEELMFRVILQGWLTTVLKPAVAIPIVAVGFAAIHGPTDGIALLPLAGLLGYVFHRRHSYVAVLVIHAMFNGTMLLLAVLTGN